MFALNRFRDIFVKNRQRIVLITLAFGGSYFVYRFFRNRILSNESKQVREFMEKARRIQHFESTERTCNQMIVSINVEMLELINKKLDVNEILHQLRTNPANKVALWEEIKVLSVTRLTVVIYTTTIVAAMLRIQLNLLGGYLYRDAKENGNRCAKVTEHIKQRYLSIIHQYMYCGGLDSLIERVKDDIQTILKDVPLNRFLSLADIDHLFWAAQMSMNNSVGLSPCIQMCEFLISTIDQLEASVETCKLIECLLYETMDMIETEDTVSLCVLSSNRGFTTALKVIAQEIGIVVTGDMFPNELNPCSLGNEPWNANEMKTPDLKDGEKETENNENSKKLKHVETVFSIVPRNIFNEEDGEDNINNRKLTPLAKVIPIINALTANGYDNTLVPETFITSFINNLINSEKCKTLGANVYETFSTLPII